MFVVKSSGYLHQKYMKNIFDLITLYYVICYGFIDVWMNETFVGAELLLCQNVQYIKCFDWTLSVTLRNQNFIGKIHLYNAYDVDYETFYEITK